MRSHLTIRSIQGANPESFGGGDVILNLVEFYLNVKTFRPGNGRK